MKAISFQQVPECMCMNYNFTILSLIINDDIYVLVSKIMNRYMFN